MIALQSRGAKMLDPTAQTAKFVNMMNMAKQQEAAQRQASLAQQSMDIDLAEEGRQKELHGPALKKAQLEYVGLVADQFSRDVAKLKEGDVAGAEALRANVVKEIPAWNDYIRPASEWTTEYRTQLMLKGKEIADKTIPDVVASKEYAGKGAVDAQGNPIPENTIIDTRIGGFTGAARSTPLRDTSADTPAPRATPTAAPEMSPSPVPVGGFGETRVAPDGGQLDEFQQDHVRRMKEGLGMSNTPASFTGGAGAGQITPEVMSRIADSAFQTGVIAQVDFDQLLATQPPENRQAFTDAFRRANITLQADAPSLADSGMGQQQMAANPVQTPQARFADMRGPALQSQTAGLRGAPPMEQTMAQYIPVQRRDPNVAPAPAETPEQAGRRALLGRSSPAEEAAKEIAKLQAIEAFEEANKGPRLKRKIEEVYTAERAKKDSDFLETYTDSTSKSRIGLNVLDQMIGDARIEKGRVVIPKGGRAPHPGFEGVVGLGFPGVRFVQGTEAANFDGLLEQIKSNAFLKAFNDLRGGGSITVIEGDKATAALTRMSRAQSEIEFVRAAQEFRDTLRDGIKNADKRYVRLTGETPAAAPARRKTPTKGSDGWGQAKVVGN
jgi:hypothetical protein